MSPGRAGESLSSGVGSLSAGYCQSGVGRCRSSGPGCAALPAGSSVAAVWNFPSAALAGDPPTVATTPAIRSRIYCLLLPRPGHQHFRTGDLVAVFPECRPVNSQNINTTGRRAPAAEQWGD